MILMGDHILVEHPNGWLCESCGLTWSYKPKHLCPQMTQYRYGEWPDTLMTRNQLNAAGYQTGRNLPPVAAVVYRSKSPDGWLRLYDPAQATPKRPVSDDQRENLDRARQMARREYQCALVAQHLLDSPDTVILDTETTGLSACEVVQVALIDATGQTLLDTLVKPERPERMFDRGRRGLCAHDIHGIHPDHLQDAPTFPEFWQQLCALVDDKEIVIYNAGYDLDVLESQRIEHKLPKLAYRKSYCAMMLYSEYCGARWRRGGYRYQPLPGGDHSALGDCVATLKIMQSMVKAEITNG